MKWSKIVCKYLITYLVTFFSSLCISKILTFRSNNAPSVNKKLHFQGPLSGVGAGGWDDEWAQATTEWGLVESSRRGRLATVQDSSSTVSLSYLSPECWSSSCCFAITGHLECKGQWTATNDSSRLPLSWILIKGEKDNTLSCFRHRGLAFLLSVGLALHPTNESRFTFAEQEGADSTMRLLRVFPHRLEGAPGWDSSHLFIG